MSGRISFARTTASSPLSTVTIRTSSFAKLIPTTFWIVTLSSARSSVLGMCPPRARNKVVPAARELARSRLLSSPRRGRLTPFFRRARQASGRPRPSPPASVKSGLAAADAQRDGAFAALERR